MIILNEKRVFAVLVNVYFFCLMPHIPLTDVTTMQARLIKEYEGAICNVQFMPVDEDKGLPLSEIYGSVWVYEDRTAIGKKRRPDKLLSSVADMFYVKDRLAKKIILKGEVGHGKTVFCMKVLDCWSKAQSSCRGIQKEKGGENEYMGKYTEGQQGSGSDRSSEKAPLTTAQSGLSYNIYDDDNDGDYYDEDKALQSCLSVFHLVFYVPLRHAKHGTASIVDLVVESLSECDQKTELKIKQIIRDGSISCLIILDGLDEWRAPDTCRVRGFPDSDGLVNCTILCTMRPWRMISLQLRLDATCDKIVQIRGFRYGSVNEVIRNFLVNVYGLKISSDLYEEKYSHLYSMARLPELRPLMDIPLILSASCHVWTEEGDIFNERQIDQATSYFKTLFYLKIKELLITRAENKHDIVKSFLFEKRQKSDTSMNVPSILLGFEQIIDFIEILKSVGGLAMQDLVSEKPHLVFPRNKLEREIGQSTVELALKAGILSQTKAPSFSYQQRVSVGFYHKSIQEFIAALYMTCGDGEEITSFRTDCYSVDKVMELSNMIIFVCGLDAVIGCQLSEHVNDVINRDIDILRYRESGNAEGYKKVSELYKIQCKWIYERKHNMSHTRKTDRTPTLNVTDVCLEYCDCDFVSLANDLVSMGDNIIVSVYLDTVEHPVHSIIQHLPGCKHLTALYIRNIQDTQDRKLLAEVLPQLVQLQCVVYGYSAGSFVEKFPQADTAVVRNAQHLQQLRYIELWNITLTDYVTLPPQLETVKLYDVKAAHFILPSVCQCNQLKCTHLKCITLTDTVVLPPQVQEVMLSDVNSAYFILPSLPGCSNLTLLHMRCLESKRDCEVLASVLPQLSQLQEIHYHDDWLYCLGRGGGLGPVVSALQHLTQLIHIKLEDIDLGDDGTLLVTAHMTQLREVLLSKVRMSARRWTEFVASLLSVQHRVHVTLTDTDIDRDILKTIRSSPHFTQENRYLHSLSFIKFHTVQ